MNKHKTTLLVFTGLYAVTGNVHSAVTMPAVDYVTSVIKSEAKYESKNYVGSGVAAAKAASLVLTELGAEAEQLRSAISAQRNTLNTLVAHQEFLVRLAEGSPVAEAKLLGTAIKVRHEITSTVSVLGELQSTLSKSISLSTKMAATTGKFIGYSADIASVGLDIMDYSQSQKTLLDNMVLMKNLAAAGTSLVPVYGQVVGATDLAVDLMASSLDKSLDIGRKWSLEDADRYRRLASDAMNAVRQEIDHSAKKGIALDAGQILRIQQRKALFLINDLDAEKIKFYAFDDDVASNSHAESMAFALKLKTGLNLEILTERSTKLVEFYAALDTYNKTAREAQEQEQQIKALVAKLEQSTDKLPSAEDLEDMMFGRSDPAPAQPESSNQTDFSQNESAKNVADHVRRRELAAKQKAAENTKSSGKNFTGFATALHQENLRTEIHSIPISSNAVTVSTPSANFNSTLARGPVQLEHTASASQFDYLSWGTWSGNLSLTIDGRTNDFTSGSFIIGSHTSITQMPKTGSATYSGLISGQYSESGALSNDLGGTVNLTANFNTMKIGGGFVFKRGDGTNLLTVQLPSSSGNINGNQFYGSSLQSPGAHVGGHVTGKFYGNQGQEIGGTVQVNSSNTAISGIFGAQTQ